MRRVGMQPRANWIEKVEALGFTFHSLDAIYWDESAAYSFSMDQINTLEKATNELHAMCLEAVQHIIDKQLFSRFKISAPEADLVINSWNEDHPAIYGRFDLAYNPAVSSQSSIKLLEYNADTPTSLFEASVIQWNWLQDYNSAYDQFNSIHERLIDYWKYLIPYLKGDHSVCFACISEHIEDLTTTEYMRDTAAQAGIETKLLYMEHIGLNQDENTLCDMDEKQIHNLFKLYPWEWLLEEEFSSVLFNNPATPYFIEPAWKMLLSNKMILTVLWEMFPNHKYLLPAYTTPEPFTTRGMDYISKPILGREGNNIGIYKSGILAQSTDGNYANDDLVYQELCKIPSFDGNYPVIGSWVIGGEAAGIGIRESDTPITGNTSRFIPHFITA
ncbi:MAG: glutathionylspermidine synthase family protein [Ignavibacteriales bacterium]|nr:glutathionylspermidine synthase family protein [Ignavibacteriales bacterium]